MHEKAKARGFAARVAVAEKASVSKYLNEEIKRHIDIFNEQQQKVKDWYQGEKTKIRRGFRQKQSERAKNHLSGETKDGLDEKKQLLLEKLKAEWKTKGADPVQVKIIGEIKEALAADPENVEMDADSIPIVGEDNVSTHLGKEKSI